MPLKLKRKRELLHVVCQLYFVCEINDFTVGSLIQETFLVEAFRPRLFPFCRSYFSKVGSFFKEFSLVLCLAASGQANLNFNETTFRIDTKRD